MGWNQVRQTRSHALWAGIPDHTHFYFVHSYYAVPADPALTIGETDYGVTFTCAVAAANIFAVQFPPEKSAAHGLRLYRNFRLEERRGGEEGVGPCRSRWARDN